MKFRTIDPKDISQPALHGYLLSAVAPRPICFASTIDRAGNVNLSPFSFFNVFSSNPPIVVFSPSRRAQGSANKDTYNNVIEVAEVVVNIVNYSMVEQMSLASANYEKGVNEFVKAGFTEVPSEKVTPPRVGESPVALECIVENVIALGEGGGAGNLIIARVVLIHIDETFLDERDHLDTTRLDLVGRMGGNWYSRATGDALFEVAKPLSVPGMGVDQLPLHIRNSPVLTGTHLGKLGSLNRLPGKEEVELIKKEAIVKSILTDHSQTQKGRLHQLAGKFLDEGETGKAFCILLLEEAV